MQSRTNSVNPLTSLILLSQTQLRSAWWKIVHSVIFQFDINRWKHALVLGDLSPNEKGQFRHANYEETGYRTIVLSSRQYCYLNGADTVARLQNLQCKVNLAGSAFVNFLSGFFSVFMIYIYLFLQCICKGVFGDSKWNILNVSLYGININTRLRNLFFRGPYYMNRYRWICQMKMTA